MPLVRFFEGPFENDLIIHDTEMPIVPRVGESITIRWPSQIADSRFEVLAVDYLFEIREGIEVKNDLIGARVQIKPK